MDAAWCCGRHELPGGLRSSSMAAAALLAVGAARMGFLMVFKKLLWVCHIDIRAWRSAQLGRNAQWPTARRHGYLGSADCS
jgi:hypothetical protein